MNHTRSVDVTKLLLQRIISPFCLLAFLGTLAYSATVNIGYVSFDITNPPLAEFDIQNQSGPNSSSLPDTSFPVTTPVSLTSLSLTVNFLTGPSQTFGMSYFTLGSDGLSYNGANTFNEDPIVGDPVTSATLSGTFASTALTLNDGSTMTIGPSFTAAMMPSSGPTLLDGDFAIIAAGPGSSSPEPATWALLSGGLVFLFLFHAKHRLKGLSKRVSPQLLVIPCLLVSFFLSGALKASAAVKLSQTTSPSTGVAGSTSVSITGSGFPGGLTAGNVTLELETSCGVTTGETPAIASQVRNIIGSTDRIEFQLPASLATATYYVTVSGTTFASTNCAAVQVTHTSTTLSACNPGSSIGMLVPAAGTGTTPVTAYVPNANWGSGATGVQVVPIEGTGTPSSLSTTDYINSCSTDSSNGITACTADGSTAQVYLIAGTAITKTVSTASNAYTTFSGGTCYNCGIAVNSVTHQAAITMGYAGSPAALQFLDLVSGTLGTPVPTIHTVSEDILWDPFRNLILSPNEAIGPGGFYDLYQITGRSLPGPSTVTLFTRTQAAGSYLDSAGEDCTTGIALSTSEATGNLYIADLKQSTFTAGSPGTWSAPAQVQYFPEFTGLSAGTSAVAIAQGSTHQGVVAGEFGGDTIGVIQLPATSGPGTGTPSALDYAYATLPSTPDGYAFYNGFDPHTTTAYTSPNSGKAYAVAASWATGTPAYLAIIDIQAMLNATRSTGTHTVSPGVNLLTSGIVRYVATH